MTNSIADIEESDCIMICGSNTSECHPVIADRVRRAAQRNGAKLIVAEPREIDLSKESNLYLQQKPGTDTALLNGMMHVIYKEDLWDKEFVKERTENFEALVETIEKYDPETVEGITGVPAEKIIKAARMYGSADNASFLYAMGITQHVAGTDNVKTVANLAMLTGNLGNRGGGVNPLRGQNNVQGACDMGGLPNVYPAYQPVTDEKNKEKFEKAWGAKLSSKMGIKMTELGENIKDGKIKGLYIMGENPLMSDPDLNNLKEELSHLDLVIVQDIFLTETGEVADVVLPSACYAEKDGTFTNTERRVQRIRKAVPAPGSAKNDIEIINGISKAVGYEMENEKAEDVFNELRKLTPSYGGISYERIERNGLHWPCPDEEASGDPSPSYQGFPKRKGAFQRDRVYACK